MQNYAKLGRITSHKIRETNVASLQSQPTRWQNDALCVTSTLPMCLFRPFYVLRTNFVSYSFCKRFLHSSAILSSTVNLCLVRIHSVFFDISRLCVLFLFVTEN